MVSEFQSPIRKDGMEQKGEIGSEPVFKAVKYHADSTVRASVH